MFTKFIDANGLIDMSLKGCRFTWNNNRDDGNVRERVDRMMYNGAWQFKFPDASLSVLPALGSDHSPLVLTLQPTLQQHQKAFTYEEFWETHGELPSLIKELWVCNQETSIDEKIDRIKNVLTTWNKMTFKRADWQIRKLKSRLTNLENNNTGGRNMQEIRHCKNLINNLWEPEELFWKSRSRLKWLCEGDRNSKYFHATALQRRGRNRVTRLRNANGDWIEDNVELKNMINDYFVNLFDTSNPVGIEDITSLIQPRVTSSMNEKLLKPVEEWEIKKGAFDLGPHKALEPDNLNGLFFKHHWEVVKDDIITTVRCFFTTGAFPPSLNETQITLVPKINTPKEVGHLGPISCCNYAYKIISKLMAERMKAIMSSIFSNTQSAFVQGRQI